MFPLTIKFVLNWNATTDPVKIRNQDECFRIFLHRQETFDELFDKWDYEYAQLHSNEQDAPDKINTCAKKIINENKPSITYYCVWIQDWEYAMSYNSQQHGDIDIDVCKSMVVTRELPIGEYIDFIQLSANQNNATIHITSFPIFQDAYILQLMADSVPFGELSKHNFEWHMTRLYPSFAQYCYYSGTLDVTKLQFDEALLGMRTDYNPEFWKTFDQFYYLKEIGFYKIFRACYHLNDIDKDHMYYSKKILTLLGVAFQFMINYENVQNFLNEIKGIHRWKGDGMEVKIPKQYAKKKNFKEMKYFFTYHILCHSFRLFVTYCDENSDYNCTTNHNFTVNGQPQLSNRFQNVQARIKKEHCVVIPLAFRSLTQYMKFYTLQNNFNKLYDANAFSGGLNIAMIQGAKDFVNFVFDKFSNYHNLNLHKPFQTVPAPTYTFDDTMIAVKITQVEVILLKIYSGSTLDKLVISDSVECDKYVEFLIDLLDQIMTVLCYCHVVNNKILVWSLLRICQIIIHVNEIPKYKGYLSQWNVEKFLVIIMGVYAKSFGVIGAIGSSCESSLFRMRLSLILSMTKSLKTKIDLKFQTSALDFLSQRQENFPQKYIDGMFGCHLEYYQLFFHFLVRKTIQQQKTKGIQVIDKQQQKLAIKNTSKFAILDQLFCLQRRFSKKYENNYMYLLYNMAVRYRLCVMCRKRNQRLKVLKFVSKQDGKSKLKIPLCSRTCAKKYWNDGCQEKITFIF